MKVGLKGREARPELKNSKGAHHSCALFIF
jgi:hypothetical protein